MTLKDYKNAGNLLHDFHHAKAMDALRTCKVIDGKDFIKPWTEYKKHSQICEDLMRIRLEGLSTFIIE